MKVLRKAFKQQLDAVVSEFVASAKEDQHLVDVDITGSLAHVEMLRTAKLVTEAQAKNLSDGLRALLKLSEEGKFELALELEDVHMNVEKRLEELIGADAKLLHTARSRNDQVALDLRLFILGKTRTVMAALAELQTALIDKAEKHAEAILPGYTHLQRAQPISFAHAFHAYFEMFARDYSRFADSIQRASTSPLGAGALVGSSLPICPDVTAAALQFEHQFANSIDAVSDRDFVAEFLFAASLTSVHLSQLAETLIIWCTREFGFVEFPDSLTTASSLMPQKKNPDPIELVRGKTGIVIGELVNLLVTLKALPLGYNRDLQESKPGAIKVAQELESALYVMKEAIVGLSVCDQNALAAAKDPELMCTDLVEYLVNRGVAFRAAHDNVSGLVQHARDQAVSLPELPIAEYKKFSDKFEDDVYLFLSPEQSVKSKNSPGGTGTSQVARALQEARKRIGS
ncbi:MAG TPA: argininosuccinate lyase [Chroococcales cyanobacterium]